MANLLNAILDATAYLTQRGIDLPEGTAVAIKRWQIERAGFEGIKTIAYYDRSLSRAVRDFYSPGYRAPRRIVRHRAPCLG